MIPRRYLYRIVRLRNIVAFTLFVILLYMLKSLSEVGLPADIIATKNALHIKLGLGTDYFVPSSLKKIDWHNYQQINEEGKRVGIGEHGKPAHLSSSEKGIEEQLYAVNGFNGALSDKISLNRSLPDIRHKGCKDRLYIESLPTVSVVVPFHNEHWSTLLRTAYSVLNRSPDFLIKEIFLVDDASTKDFLKEKLDEYVSKFLPKVKVLRLEKRSGLITARLAGAKQAKADVLIFLDSHTEATVNWLPPLLEPIALDHRTVVCPFIDVIAYDTFEYRPQDEGARGAFDWEFYYKRLPVLPKDEKNMPEPFESPVMAGGLFAISRSFFWELGGYDPGLDIWGGEQYELSFKVWQCGGRMVDAPCSRVGHIYRKFAPFPNPGHGDFVGRNYRRVAEVWMDEYAQYLYMRRPHYKDIDTGDISEQKALREKLKCKPFRWFIKQVAFDLVHKYPPVEPPPFAEGKIRPLSHPQLCVDARRGEQNDKLLLKPCSDSAAAEQKFIFSWHKDIRVLKPCLDSAAAEQKFIFSWHKDIRIKDRKMCWDLPNSTPKSPILLYGCHLGGGNQLWRYHMDLSTITAGTSNNCLEWEKNSRDLYINRCSGIETQRWGVDILNEDMLAKWDTMMLRVTGPDKSY